MACVFLLTGLSGAGKTTLAEGLARRMAAKKPLVILDGDAMRKGVCADLGFSPQDRAENIRRCGEMAKLLTAQGINVLLAVIAPYAALRADLARILGADLRIVHVACPLEVCIARDPKQNYRKALAGQMRNYTGIADAYEPPVDPHLTLRTHCMTLNECLDQLERFALAEIARAELRAD